MMQLWVAGFNAWGQLHLGDAAPWSLRDRPHDIPTFQKSLEDAEIHVLWTGLSATLVQTTRGLQSAGDPDEITKLIAQRPALGSGLAIAGNDKIADHYKNNLGQFADIRGAITSVVANQISFTALSSTGEVWTWGDGRYPSCFCRDVSDQNPATVPGLVKDLNDLPTGPIKKIASGGYITAALTEGNDLYIWGGRPGQSDFLNLSGDPLPVDLEGEDFLDFAVGYDHILALTTNGRLFVVGSGSNGQLGMHWNQLGDWKEVFLVANKEQRIIRIYAGYKTSFVVTQGEKNVT